MSSVMRWKGVGKEVQEAGKLMLLLYVGRLVLGELWSNRLRTERWRKRLLELRSPRGHEYAVRFGAMVALMRLAGRYAMREEATSRMAVGFAVGPVLLIESAEQRKSIALAAAALALRALQRMAIRRGYVPEWLAAHGRLDVLQFMVMCALIQAAAMWWPFKLPYAYWRFICHFVYKPDIEYTRDVCARTPLPGDRYVDPASGRSHIILSERDLNLYRSYGSPPIEPGEKDKPIYHSERPKK